jgi:hypothetical protein
MRHIWYAVEQHMHCHLTDEIAEPKHAKCKELQKLQES